MPMITIDGKEYDFDSLSDAARQQLQSLQFVDAELARLAAQNAVLQTARMAYSNALRQALTSAPNPLFSGDTIKFSS